MALSNKYPLPISQTRPGSTATESYRTLRTNVQFTGILHDTKVIQITSSVKGEGKTLTAVNLAVVSAQAGKKVLLIDADLRNPQVHANLHVSTLAGLSSLLVKETPFNESVIPTEVSGLFVLPCGPIPPNPSEILSSVNFLDVILQCRNQFDLVIIDSPPLLPVSDPIIISRTVDGVILVINAKKTSRNTVHKALSMLQQANRRILGSVLNRTSKGAESYAYVPPVVPIKGVDGRSAPTALNIQLNS